MFLASLSISRDEVFFGGSACFFFVTRKRVLRSRVGFSQSIEVESFTKSGECSLTIREVQEVFMMQRPSTGRWPQVSLLKILSARSGGSCAYLAKLVQMPEQAR